jgi:hypothetical protein
LGDRATVGLKVLYDQADGFRAGLLDSNVVLEAGNANPSANF